MVHVGRRVGTWTCGGFSNPRRMALGQPAHWVCSAGWSPLRETARTICDEREYHRHRKKSARMAGRASHDSMPPSVRPRQSSCACRGAERPARQAPLPPLLHRRACACVEWPRTRIACFRDGTGRMVGDEDYRRLFYLEIVSKGTSSKKKERHSRRMPRGGGE